MELNGTKPFLRLNFFFFACDFEGGYSFILFCFQEMSLEGRVEMASCLPSHSLNLDGLGECHLDHTARAWDSIGKDRLQLECEKLDSQLIVGQDSRRTDSSVYCQQRACDALHSTSRVSQEGRTLESHFSPTPISTQPTDYFK